MFQKKMIHTMICASFVTCASAWAKGEAALEEIIVTAQKRAENVQDVPISIQTLDAAALEKNVIVSLTDMRSQAPGVTINNFPLAQESTLFITMRGSQQFSAAVTLDQPVAIHLNGVYLARSDGLNSVTAADLERVEILKGPQGTLVGRNAVAGAVNIVTAKPTFDGFHFKQQVTVATRDQLVTKTAANLPITDALAARISYLHKSIDEPVNGIKNSGPGPELGTSQTDAWRLDFRWKPASMVTVDYGYDFTKMKLQDQPFVCLGATTILANKADCTSDYRSTLTGVSAQPDSEIEVEGHTVNVDWVASDTLTVRSITGYRKLTETYYKNMIYSSGNYGYIAGPVTSLPPASSVTVPMPASSVPSIVNQDQISQEFQFVGRPSDYFNYTAGLYYFEEKGYEAPSQYSYRPSANSATLIRPHQAWARNESWAAYGQFSWRPDVLSRKLEIVPGVRYTRDTRDVSVIDNGIVSYALDATSYRQSLGPTPTQSGSGHLTGSKVTPSLSVMYHFDDQMMGYGKIVKGYRTGGFNMGDGNLARALTGFSPETLTSQELGFKGQFFENRLRTNLAYFVMDYKDQQMQIADPQVVGRYTAIIANAGKSQIKGLELEVAYAVTKNLRLGLSWTRLDLEYKKVVAPGTTTNVASRFYRKLPKNNYTVNVDYRFPDLGFPGRLEAHLDYSHMDAQSGSTTDGITQGGVFAGFTATKFGELDLTPAYSVWNGRLALNGISTAPDGQGDVSVGLWAKNLTDKKYLSYVMAGAPFGGITGTALGLWAPRRTVGFDVIYRF
ncbi:TonB-dependent receptor [Denitratisoma oestradiolicum]|uniref:Putative TonB-dependent receptor n=1 Tax=Denitratisoma oestradiolicum TaxID=311182 RepID=A0A6S6XVR8_9PROT|nr:TonB-dependent receptor [Denitratisoma oestradiolicum]TWO79024.1 hypothetical protein CBW56_17015 [Denitratisoma oestradiolicum]CAB1368313.1 putative TonB-dependent receptor [Denitratisoma oestradiolicum]